MNSNIVRVHSMIQHYEAIGSWFMAKRLRALLITLMVGLSGCAKPSSHDSLACSGIDLNEQQVSWPDGVSRKSDVYHCNNGMDLVKDNGDLSHEFWR